MKVITISKDNKRHEIVATHKEDILLIGNEGGEVEIDITLASINAEAQLHGLVLGIDDLHYSIKTRTNHEAENTRSRVLLKGVFTDKSALDYEGLINIENKAQLSDAYLQNDNLMLSDDAVVNSSPQLEIKADDVKASHGVTITTLDDYEKYYLESRGLREKDSERLIIEGFISDIIKEANEYIDVSSILKTVHYG